MGLSVNLRDQLHQQGQVKDQTLVLEDSNGSTNPKENCQGEQSCLQKTVQKRKEALHRDFHRIKRVIRREEGKGDRGWSRSEGRGLLGFFRHQKPTARRGLDSTKEAREVLRLGGLLQKSEASKHFVRKK